MVEYFNKNQSSPKADFLCNPVAKQILDFLDGRTRGAELLHALYDHVLDEPIPKRMRELLKK